MKREIGSSSPAERRRAGADRAGRPRVPVQSQPLEPRVLLAFTPVGEPMLVETGFFIDTRPAVAVDSDGDFVVAFERREGPGGSEGPSDIYGRRFNRDFVPQGGEFLINTQTIGNQVRPKVAMDADGDFVVAWYTDTLTLSGSAWARRYHANGVPAGADFRLTTGFSAADSRPAVAMDAAGNFVVAWMADVLVNPPAPYTREHVYARRYNADGSVRGATNRVDLDPIAGADWPAVAMDADGDFVVAWHEGYPADSSRVMARRFDPSDRPLQEGIVVSDVSDRPDLKPAVAMDRDGDFVVAWSNEYAFSRSQGYARRFDPTGAPQGDRIPLHPPPGRNDNDMALAVHPDGDAVAVWEDQPMPVSDYPYAVRGRVLPAAGGAGEAFAVAVPFDGSAPVQPAVAIDGEGDAVVAWVQRPSSTPGGIYLRRHELSPPRDLPARVQGVFASSARWAPSFRRALAAQGMGDEALGVAVGGPAIGGWRGDRRELPWRSLDRVSVRFDDDVVVAADDLKVLGTRFSEYPVARAADGSPAFSYDAATRTATWTLARPMDEDVVTVEVDGDAPSGVTDSRGLPFDGNADAAPGGDFSVRFDALAGDAVPEGVVNALDLSYVKQRLNTSAASPGTGAAAYSVFADLDGDGRVNALDLGLVRQRLNRRLAARRA